jgi:hypothetical protein
MKYVYANKKFTAAVSGMATSPKNIQERVGDAFINHLMRLETEELPKEIRLKFGTVFQRLTKCEPIGNKGSVRVTIDQMSTDEGIEIAMDIVHMADILHSKSSE